MTAGNMTLHENLYSELSRDPELAELVDAFVAEIPNRVAQITEQAEAHDWEKLGRTAHQLKGAAGSYGFHAVTRPAFRLEQAAAKRANEGQILAAVTELVELCRRIRGGPAPPPSVATAVATPHDRL
jgi:HPt (histidine-containing phosphotransfer) domain-containing protein